MSELQSLFGKFDADGNGQISQSEFENAIGPDADQAKVDALFSKIDGNGDGSISQDEMQSGDPEGARRPSPSPQRRRMALARKGGGDPLQALLSGASADGTTSQIRHQCGRLDHHDLHLRRWHQGRDDDAGGIARQRRNGSPVIRRRQLSPTC